MDYVEGKLHQGFNPRCTLRGVSQSNGAPKIKQTAMT